MSGTAKFRLGCVVGTPHALEILSNEDILAGITRHQAGDWGDVCFEDKLLNDRAVVEVTRILSAYRTVNGTTFWIITEAGRPEGELREK